MFWGPSTPVRRDIGGVEFDVDILGLDHIHKGLRERLDESGVIEGGARSESRQVMA